MKCDTLYVDIPAKMAKTAILFFSFIRPFYYCTINLKMKKASLW